MTVLHLLQCGGRVVRPLFVNYGQAAAEQESVAAAKIASHFDLPLAQVLIANSAQFGAGEIRHRNGFLVFTAATFNDGDIDSVAIGIHAGVPYADCSVAFLESLSVTLRHSHVSSLQLLAPLRTWNKAEIIAFAKRENLPLDLTYSCEVGSTSPCGKCASCLDRTLIDVR